MRKIAPLITDFLEAMAFIAAVIVFACVIQADTRPIPEYAPTLAPPKVPAVEQTLADHCDGVRIWDFEVVDGDTWDCQWESVCGTVKISSNGRVRMRGSNWDAWESSHVRQGITYHPNEMELGRKASEALDSMTSKASGKYVLFVRDGGFSRDGVRLFWVQESGSVVEAGPWMKSHGHDRGSKRSS